MKVNFAGPRLSLLITLSAWQCLSHPAFAQDSQPKKYAVLVGVENYEHASLRDPPLKYASDDVTDLARLLKDAGYIVTLLTDETAAASVEMSPTHDRIIQQISSTLEKCRAPDTVLLAFAGHGLQFAGQPDAYFCPSDARPFADRTDTLVSITSVYQQLERSFAGVKIIFVDACRNDPSPGRGRGVDADSAPAPPRGVAALFSCSAGQRAFEHDELRHGVFFHHVLQGLRGEAANRNGDITFQLLSNYVCSEVPGDVSRLLPQQRQFPNMKADLVGVPPVLAHVTAPVKAAAPPAVPPAAVTLPLPSVSQQQQARRNFKDLMIAMHEYEAGHMHLPPAVVFGKDGKGKAPHSWRVEILPFLGKEGLELYESYQFDQAWNSPGNRKILDAMPAVFRSPLDDPKSTFTSVFAFTPPLSPDGRVLSAGKFLTAFSDPLGQSLIKFHDGMTSGIVLVEARRQIPWTQPEDLVYETDKPLPAVGGWFSQGFHCGMGDGSTLFLARENSVETLRGMIQINDEKLIPDWRAMDSGRPEESPLIAVADFPPVGRPSLPMIAVEQANANVNLARIDQLQLTGNELLAKRSFKEAIASFDEGLKLDPHSWPLLLSRGNAWNALKDYPRAVADYRAAVVAAPTRFETLTRLSWMLATCPDVKIRDGKEAFMHAEAAIKRNADNPDVIDALAAANAEVGDFLEARRLQKLAIEVLSADQAAQTPRGKELLSGFLERQQKYEKKQPHREE